MYEEKGVKGRVKGIKVVFLFLMLVVLVMYGVVVAYGAGDGALVGKGGAKLEEVSNGEKVGVEGAGGGKEERSFLDIAGNVVFWNFVTFGILVLVLGKYGWRPIMAIIDARGEKIKEELKKAEEGLLKSEKLLEERQDLISKAYKEGQEILSKSQETAEKAAEVIIKKAEGRAEALLEGASKEIEDAKQTALKELKTEVGNISLEIASKVVGMELDDLKHKELIEKMLEVYGGNGGIGKK